VRGSKSPSLPRIGPAWISSANTIPPNQVFILYSDYNNFDLLEKANIREASIVFINLDDDTEKLVYIINIKKHFSDLNYVVTLDNGILKAPFHHAGVTYAISQE